MCCWCGVRIVMAAEGGRHPPAFAPALCANSHLSKQQAEALHYSRSRAKQHCAPFSPRLQQSTPLLPPDMSP
jgi:hypothetical protein